MSDNINLILVGCGAIGIEYYKVLTSLQINPNVVGRGPQKASEFRKKTGVMPVIGGLEKALASPDDIIPEYAIIAVDAINLAKVAVTAIRNGIKYLLIEKPAGMSKKEIQMVADEAFHMNAHVYVAYNRHFYSSTERALDIIKADGGVSSFFFEFTEWSNTIKNLTIPTEIKENTLLANSSHVIDLAFFLGGHPVEMSSYIGGSLHWHHNGSKYSGAGYTDTGATFSYCADWAAPGRWSVEIMTNKHRLYFKPMEKLAVQQLNSVKIEALQIDDDLDLNYKPGFYKQVEAFLFDRNDSRLITIEEHLNNVKWYERIAGIAGDYIRIE